MTYHSLHETNEGQLTRQALQSDQTLRSHTRHFTKSHDPSLHRTVRERNNFNDNAGRQPATNKEKKMKLNAYTIYDAGTQTYMRPFFTQADGAATREFCDLAQNADHPIGKHPADYTLYRCGSYNDGTGEITPEKLHKLKTGPEAIADGRKINGQQLDAFDQEISNGPHENK